MRAATRLRDVRVVFGAVLVHALLAHPALAQPKGTVATPHGDRMTPVEASSPSSAVQDHSEQLFFAAMTGDLELAVASLAAGADANYRNQHGISPLLVVAGGAASNVGIMDALLSSSADPDLPDNEGWTALIYAASSGQMPLLRSLLQAGASVHARSAEKEGTAGGGAGGAPAPPTGGWTPLTRAAFRGQAEAARALLAAGADPAATTAGRDAYALAVEGGHEEAAAVLAAAAAPRPAA